MLITQSCSRKPPQYSCPAARRTLIPDPAGSPVTSPSQRTARRKHGHVPVYCKGLCAQRRRPLWTWEGAAKKGCRQCEAFPALFLLLPHGAPGWRHEHTWTGNPETWFQGGSLCTLPVSIGQFAFSGNHFFIQPTESWVATCWPELSSWGQSSIRLLQPSAGAGGLCVGLRGPSSCLSLFPFAEVLLPPPSPLQP